MAKASLRSRFVRTVMAVALGGSVFQLSGCDPAVRSTLLDGLQATTTSLSTALISAFFLGLENNNDGTDTLTTT